MNVAASLWAIGLVCLIGALVGQAIKVMGNELPALAPRARVALAVVGVLALILGTVTFLAANTRNDMATPITRNDTPGVEPTNGQPSTSSPSMKWSDSSNWSDRVCLANETCTIGDVNGDNRDDAIAFVNDSASEPAAQNKAWVALSTGSEFEPRTLWSDRVCLANETCTIGDVNGDNRDDAIAFVNNSASEPAAQNKAWVALSTGSEFEPRTLWSDRVCLANETCTIGDVNGDNRDDAIAFVRDSKPEPDYQNAVWVALSTGSEFGSSTAWSGYMCLANETCTVGDVNGDNRDDVITFAKDSASEPAAQNKVWVALSTGSELELRTLWSDYMCLANEICTVGDVNGDNRDDAIAFVRDSKPEPDYQNAVWVALSTGSEFGSSTAWSGYMCLANETCTVGDVNGDNRDDAIAFVRDSKPEPDYQNAAWVALS